jgi:two-component system NtrC family sensor kinase
MFLKKVYAILPAFLLLLISAASAQEQKIADSLELIYRKNTLHDTAKLELLKALSYNEMHLKKSLQYAEELISVSQKLNNDKYLRSGYFLKGTKERMLGNLDQALAAYFKSADIVKNSQHLAGEGEAYGAIADIYSVGNNHPTAISYYQKAIKLLRQSKNSINLASVLANAGDEYRNAGSYDSALVYLNEAGRIFDKAKDVNRKAYCLGDIGMVYAYTGKNNLAERNINLAIAILEKTQDYYPICDYLLSMADVYISKHDDQSALNYSLRSLNLAERYRLKEQISQASSKLSSLYEKAGNTKEALAYYKKHIIYRDSLNNINSVNRMANLRTNFEVSQKQIEVNLLTQQKRNQRYMLVSLGIILVLTTLVLAILTKNNQIRKRAYANLEKQKLETDKQRTKAEEALLKLQLTQKQLIQSAKMASLGELAAGIAHEIKNPLNFVNNFSEVNVELLAELKEGPVNQLTASSKFEADQIIDDLASNLKKINDHGKRAEAVVNGMLQHSRSNIGKKELTDINALANEYLNLNYHGMKVKDKGFNARYITDFDKSIGKMDIIPQDMASVLLNLYSNAFFAVNEKKKQLGGAFEPLVSVTTKNLGNKVEIAVKDNGIGIPLNIQDKIFQPFFTTKPTGQGTGLGLSLSYDIIMAHGGDIKVETKEGEFTEFTVQLPIGNEQMHLAKLNSMIDGKIMYNGDE